MLKTEVEDKGLDCTPNESNGIKCYDDADFSGAWCREDSEQVGSVLSRTGYIIKFANFPIVWVSKMQTIGKFANLIMYLVLDKTDPA